MIREREREFVTTVIELLIYGEKLTVCEHIIFKTGILKIKKHSPKVLNAILKRISSRRLGRLHNDVLREMREQGGLVHLGYLTLIEG